MEMAHLGNVDDSWPMILLFRTKEKRGGKWKMQITFSVKCVSQCTLLIVLVETPQKLWTAHDLFLCLKNRSQDVFAIEVFVKH